MSRVARDFTFPASGPLRPLEVGFGIVPGEGGVYLDYRKPGTASDDEDAWENLVFLTDDEVESFARALLQSIGKAT